MSLLDNSLKILLLLGTLLAVFVQITPDPLAERLATPNISAKEAVGTARGIVKLHASAESVWEDLLDFQNYGKWSTKVPRVEFEGGVLRAGGNGTITVSMRAVVERGSG